MKRIAVVLGGGAARGLAHIGVLDVLEREGIRPDCIVGSSMGALIGALAASGLSATEMVEVARRFAFPRFFVFGRMLTWDQVFPSAAEMLTGRTFESLDTRLLVTAADLESGRQVILERGRVLDAVRASCAVPGVLLPVRRDGRWLIDGGLVNILPVDVAWMADPDVVIAVSAGGLRARRMPRLAGPITSAVLEAGVFFPNPLTAKVAFELIVRASEIALAQQAQLATAMTGPEILVEPVLDDVSLRDFHKLESTVERGRRAAEDALPKILGALDGPRLPHVRADSVGLDPVCGMVVHSARARASATHDGRTYFFCSENCRDAFEHHPERYG